ncbi:ApcC hetero-tetramer Cut9-Hcn1 [Gigaspora margarita]|uniref:ApcC hetero-tetramer Cut9-Hcn1 n=1 Tax=Gigaspora margarita TaxID=4874 RepID=A0A8H4EPR7_GIGMA|nr:ApcC hetero-tetramer Cut9-Hcn1 [Gigaspora margarita]
MFHRNTLVILKWKKYQEVLDILDDENPFLDRDYNSVDKNTEGGISLEASICYLRAQEIDVKCFEAFNELVINHMMTSKEEWGFVNLLKFDEQSEYEEAYFIKNELHINAEEV